MIEVEVKAPVRDPRRIVRALMDLGAKKRGKLVQKDTYYSHPARRLELTDEALRIRVSEGRAVLAYKGPRLDGRSKSREEIEVGIGSAGAAHRVLLRLGFRPVGTVRKRRELYTLRGLRVCLDRVEGLGVFLEVEKRVERKRYPAALETVLALLRKLGLEETERRSYLELILLRGARRTGRSPPIKTRGTLSSPRRTP